MNRAISISVREQKEELWYSVKWCKEREVQSCKSNEPPRPELNKALGAFEQFVPIITMIDTKHIRYVSIDSATFNIDQKTGFTYVVLGTRITLTNNFTLELKLPEKRVIFDDEETKKSTMWEDRFSVLAQKLNDEILQYACGNRAQQHLFNEDENK